jgi:hypothetical protein
MRLLAKCEMVSLKDEDDPPSPFRLPPELPARGD